jgi:hypothetical protein
MNGIASIAAIAGALFATIANLDATNFSEGIASVGLTAGVVWLLVRWLLNTYGKLTDRLHEVEDQRMRLAIGFAEKVAKNSEAMCQLANQLEVLTDAIKGRDKK